MVVLSSMWQNSIRIGAFQMVGHYNLPKEEQDRYNVDLTQEELQAFYQKTIKQKIKRDNKLIHALPQESLDSYIQRLVVVLQQLDEQAQQEHMYGPKGPWYVHKRAQNCFICDYSTMMNQVVDILVDIIKIPKVSRLSFGIAKEGSQRLIITPKG